MKSLLTMLLSLLSVMVVAAQDDGCPPAVTRLQVGDFAQVTPGVANRLRAEPTTNAPEVGTIPAEHAIVILDGPTCANDVLWWEVDYQGETGWTAEVVGEDYALAPMAKRAFSGISFAIPNIYDETYFIGEHVPEEISDSTMPISHPDYMRFAYAPNMRGFDLRVYPLEAYAQMEPYVGEQIADLQNLLDSRPALNTMTSLPYVLRLGASQVFVGRAGYVEGTNISGIHYLTLFAQSAPPLQRDSLAYTFQGITTDGAYYVSLTMPVMVNSLPEVGDPIPYTVDEDELETYRRYVEARRTIVDSADPSSVQPSMTSLSQIALTLAIDEGISTMREPVMFQGVSFILSAFMSSSQITPVKHTNSLQFLLAEEPFMTVYPVANLIRAAPAVEETVTTLQQMLADRPNLETTLCLPYAIYPGAFQDIAVRARYVDGEETAGIAYLTRFSQQFQPYARDDLLYTFQGISGDYYVVVNYPVVVSSLPEDPELFIYDEAGPDTEAITRYFAQIVSQLNGLSPDEIAPSMEAMDDMVASIKINPETLSFAPVPLTTYWAETPCYRGINAP